VFTHQSAIIRHAAVKITAQRTASGSAHVPLENL